MKQNEPTQTTQTFNQAERPVTNKFDLAKSVINLAIQVITVVGLILGAYITIRLAPIIASQQGLVIKVNALETNVATLKGQETDVAVLKSQYEDISDSLITIENSVQETNRIILKHIMQTK